MLKKEEVANFETYTARGSVKTSVWMCIIRSPPAVYSITKHTCSAVWKQANKLTRKGWCDIFTISKMRFSHIRLQKEEYTRDKGGNRGMGKRVYWLKPRIGRKKRHKHIIRVYSG